MRKYLGFLKVSSVVIKVAAWILLLLGVVGSIPLFSGKVPGNPRWLGFVILIFYLFVFYFLFLIAKITDILVKIINEIHKD